MVYLSLFVLFQEGPFDLRIHSIEAVPTRPEAIAVSVTDFETNSSAVSFLQDTIRKAAVLYDKDYMELSQAVYKSALQTIEAADGPSEDVQGVICTGLEYVAREAIAFSSAEISWILRRIVDVALADIQGISRTPETEYPVIAQGGWLDSVSEACASKIEEDIAEVTILSSSDIQGSRSILPMTMEPSGPSLTVAVVEQAKVSSSGFSDSVLFATPLMGCLLVNMIIAMY